MSWRQDQRQRPARGWGLSSSSSSHGNGNGRLHDQGKQGYYSPRPGRDPDEYRSSSPRGPREQQQLYAHPHARGNSASDTRSLQSANGYDAPPAPSGRSRWERPPPTGPRGYAPASVSPHAGDKRLAPDSFPPASQPPPARKSRFGQTPPGPPPPPPPGPHPGASLDGASAPPFSRFGATVAAFPIPHVSSQMAASPVLTGSTSPASISSPVPSSVAAQSPVPSDATEDEKKRAKKAKLEAWKRKREAEKAQKEKEEASNTSKTPVPFKSPLAALSRPAPAPTSGPTGIQKGGLKGFSLRATALTNNKPAAPIKLPRLEDDDGPKKPALSSLLSKSSPFESAVEPDDRKDKSLAKGSDAMDVDEEDPLDAFMASVSQEVKQVDEADRTRVGGVRGTGARDEDDKSDGEDRNGESGEEEEEDQIGQLSNIGAIMTAAAKNVKKKGMPPVDHSQQDYEPFRKSFYHPPAEVQDISDADADELRRELDGIAIRGKECPRPITKWSHLGLPANTVEVIKQLGYDKLTPIQAQAIPAIMSGRDCIGVAKTGSGKTMAFLLPMLRHIKDQRPVESGEGPIALIMTPTRELAVQIYRECRPFLRGLGLRAVSVYGGVPISEQIAEIKKTAEIVVATPGRMIDLLTANSGRVTNLHRVTYLVLDEADRMFDMGFEPQVTNIVNNIRPDRQTVLFSATFPKAMESLARKVLKHKPLEVVVGGKSVVPPEIEQLVEVREEDTKFNRLLEILGQTYNEDEDARTLIFVDRQEAADDLLRELMRKGYPTMSIHGGKDQVDRDSTISDFKAGVVPIVTATSVAARGLDVKQLKLVINYDVPNHLEDYVHRAGRTGRAGNRGTAITFITPQQERYARDIVSALKASEAQIPPELQALAASFGEKVQAGKAQASGSGFRGKGLERLESDRKKALQAQQSSYGQGGDEEAADAAATNKAGAEGSGNAGTSSEATGEDTFNINELEIEVRKGPAPDFIKDNKIQAPPGDMNLNRTEQQQSTMEGAIKSAAASGADTSKLLAALNRIKEQHEARKVMLAKEGVAPARKPKDPDATDYHAIIPINDFPQKARWRTTNKETMSMLVENTGASVTSKGAFYDKGKEPSPGDPPKLQLLIESNEPAKIERAIREIKMILLEATQAVFEADARGSSAPGRYSVL